MFFKKRDHSHEYLEKELSDQLAEINSLKLELEKIKTHMISLRGSVNRRFGKDMQDETIKNKDGLDSLR